MPASIKWDPSDAVSKLALEVVRIAMESLGSTRYEQLRAAFNQKIEQEHGDQEARLRAVTCLLIKRTREGLQGVAEVQEAGFCLIWLASTHVSEWSLLRLYSWGQSLSCGGN